jgi:lipopolysaccharide transport system ATP-binding protein
MMPVIRVEDVSKRYHLGMKVRGFDDYQTLRETLVRSTARMLRPFHRLRAGGAGGATASGVADQGGDEVFWALRDVSFDIGMGEIIGVIGRNGAGKSTLLKVLSRITEPTTGRVTLRGRVGSLLEVGTGFHPELSGRENIFLNGSILGMSRREIGRKFDEIVAFAEVERFLETPVKRYSSGMYVRLAFAVAAHLDPEILVVDEVLAVGDHVFQQKCMGKMREVGRSGRTVLFVSHNMTAVESLCSRCLMLDHGRLVADDAPMEVLARYHQLGEVDDEPCRSLTNHRGRLKGTVPVMKRVALFDGRGERASRIRMGESLAIRVDFDLSGIAIRPVLGIVVKTHLGTSVFGINNRIVSGYRFDRVDSIGSITCRLDKLPLMPGSYLLDLYLGDHGHDKRDLDVVQDAIGFEVIPADVFETGKLPPSHVGPIYWPATWNVEMGDRGC